MANQYTLTNDFAAIAEEKGTLYNKGDSAIELASTADTAKGAGILLLTGERRTFSGTLYARSMDAAGLLNVADFKDGGEGGEDNLSGVPLGTILPYSANAQTPPYGFLFSEGQAISRTMYPDLFALIGTTYGEGDGETTFNLPNLTGRYPQGDTTAGTVKSAGLPNIEGSFYTKANVDSNQSTADGAFRYGTSTTSEPYLTLTSQTSLTEKYSFDASLSNPIYGNSDTVTPPTLTVRWIVKVYDAPTPSSAQVDLSQYLSDLAARLTREQTPAFNKRDIVTTSGTYTAPVTGCYRVTVKGGGGGGAGGRASTNYYSGGGGGEGGKTIGFEKLNAGDAVSVVIGAGGAGGANTGIEGANGGNTTVTVNGHSYVGGGGGGGYSNGSYGGAGGSGTIIGAPGGSSTLSITSGMLGASGGGAGGGRAGLAGIDGGGGSGGTGGSSPTAGTAGGNGFVAFEYFAAS